MTTYLICFGLFWCIKLSHYAIIAIIIVLAGLLGGYVRHLNIPATLQKEKHAWWKFTLTGLVGSALIPLLLNMISSDLIKKAEGYDILNYFIFTGFCLVAGYYSDRFISTLADKILKQTQETKEIAVEAKKEAEKAIEKVDDQNKILDVMTLINPDDLQNIRSSSQINLDDKLSSISPATIKKIVKCFNGQYRFRTVIGIAENIKQDENAVLLIMKELEKHGYAHKFKRDDGIVFWGLGSSGLSALSNIK